MPNIDLSAPRRLFPPSSAPRRPQRGGFVLKAGLFFAASLLFFCFSIPASAQTPNPTIESLRKETTAPLSRPIYSALSDSRTIALNPAGIARLNTSNLRYLHAKSDLKGDLDGLYFNLGLFPGAFDLGAMIEWRKAANSDLQYRHYALVAGLQISDLLALGIRHNFYGSERSLDVDLHQSFDVGLTWRVLHQFTISAVIESVDSPRLEGEWVKPVVRWGAGWSFWDGRLLFDASHVFTENGDASGISEGVVELEVLDGWRLFAQGEDTSAYTRWGGGLEMMMGWVSFSGGLFAGTQDGDTSIEGFSASVRLGGYTAPNVFETSERWISLQFPGNLSERPARSPFGVAGPSFASTLWHLKQIREDPSVDGVVLYIDGLGFGFGQLYELHQAIKALRTRGKTVIAHLRSTTSRSYYLACAADRIYLAPARSFSPRGLAITLTFYNKGLEAIGIHPEFVKIDRYKSAPERFTQSAPSAESGEQLGAYLDTLYDELVQAAVESRGVTSEQVRAQFDRSPGDPQEALRAGLIDGIVYRDALPEQIQKDLKLSKVPHPDEGYQVPRPRLRSWETPPRIAVIHVDGPIVEGFNIETPVVGSSATGSQSIVNSLEWASQSDSVVAIVLRVNSPGGSAHASDTIYRAIEKAKEKKPVVVSMGNVAASGGYYVAAAGDVIFASPTTLTGSIGIYFGKFDISGLYDYLGLTRHVFKRGASSNLYGSTERWTEEERVHMMKSIQFLYEIFLERVAKGRSLDIEAIRAVAGGHIWTGEPALKHGLIDRLGGLEEAMEEAARRGGLDAWSDAQMVQLPRRGPLSLWDASAPLIPSLEMQLSSFFAPESIPLSASISETEALIVGMKGVVERLGGWPIAALYSPGEVLMMLPFEWSVEP